MAYSASDLAALQSALASGERTVRFDTGREITYRSIAELKDAISEVQKDLTTTAGTRTKVVKMYSDSGF